MTRSSAPKGYLLQELLNRVAERDDLINDVIDLENLTGETSIHGARSLELASSFDLVFTRPGLERAGEKLQDSKARVALVPQDVAAEMPEQYLRTHVMVVTDRPRLLLAHLLQNWVIDSDIWNHSGIHPDAEVAPDARLAPGVVLGPDVVIGSGSTVGPNTVISNTSVGRDTFIGPNNSIGGPGFSFETDERLGRQVFFPHFGRVEIGDRVHIFANCSIARGSLRNTVIGDEVKIDNLVHISHNCEIREGAFIIANTMLGGSAVVGAGAWIGPSTSVINRGHVGQHALTGMGSVVTKTVEPNRIVAGVPAKVLRERFPPDHPQLGAFPQTSG